MSKLLDMVDDLIKCISPDDDKVLLRAFRIRWEVTGVPGNGTEMSEEQLKIFDLSKIKESSDHIKNLLFVWKDAPGVSDKLSALKDAVDMLDKHILDKNVLPIHDVLITCLQTMADMPVSCPDMTFTQFEMLQDCVKKVLYSTAAFTIKYFK